MKNKNGFGRACWILAVIIALVLEIMYLNKPSKEVKESSAYLLTPDNTDCQTEKSSNDLVGERLTVVGVFEDYICVQGADGSLYKILDASWKWQYYSYAVDSHGLTGRDEWWMKVGQTGQLINSDQFEGQYNLVGTTFDEVYGTPADFRMLKSWLKLRNKVIRKYSDIQSKPMFIENAEFSSLFTPQDACWWAKEYSFSVKIDKEFSFCQHDWPYTGYSHVDLSGGFIASEYDDDHSLYAVLPNNGDHPETLEFGKPRYELELVDCFSTVEYEKYLSIEGNDKYSRTWLPFFTYKGETYYGSGVTVDDYMVDPVGAVFSVNGQLAGKVIPYRSVLEYTYRDGDAYIQDLYALPAECDPSPNKYLWQDWIELLVWR